MLKFTVGGMTCRFSLMFPAVLLWMLCWDPSGLVLVGTAAAVVHECGHLAAFLLCRCRPDSLTVSFYGMRITHGKATSTGYLQEALIAAAGPLVNLVCAGLLQCFGAGGLFVLWHIGLAGVNLLPISPLDGAVIVSSLLHLLALPDPVVDRIAAVLSYGCFGLLVLAAIAVYIRSANITLLLFSLYIGVFMLFYKGN